MIAVIIYNQYQYEYWARINRIDIKAKECQYKRVSSMIDVIGQDFVKCIDMSYMNNRDWITLEQIREAVRLRVSYSKARREQNDVKVREIQLKS